MSYGGTGLWEARELLWSFVRRDLTVRYRHALLGVGWAIASPLAQMVVFTLVFTRVARIETGMPYPLYAFCGLTAWHFTASALRGAVTSLSGNATLVTRVAFRREVLPLAAVVVALIDFAISLPFVLALALWFGVPLRPTVLLVPFLLLVQAAFTSGMALLLAAANLFWRDVRHLFDVGITLWMFASAVLYPVPRLGGLWGTLLALNPMTPLVEGYRDLILRGTIPPMGAAAVALAAALLTFSLGRLVFQRAEPRFAEVA